MKPNFKFDLTYNILLFTIISLVKIQISNIKNAEDKFTLLMKKFVLIINHQIFLIYIKIIHIK